jgi:aspartyl/glutamyl-tRNA(Asn/Gln) amidotransferase C subunit
MISKEEIQNIAKLARLNLTDKEEENLQKDISAILGYFDSLKRLEAAKVNPAFYSFKNFSRKKLDEMREDKVEFCSEEVKRQIIKAFPAKEKNYLKVKSILN